MDRNNHKPETLEVNPAIAAVTTPEEIEILKNFLSSQTPEITEENTKTILTLIDKAADVFGEDLVKETLYYLATSRRGLHIEDLAALLGDTWNNPAFAKIAVCFGVPLVAAFENVLLIPSAPLRQILIASLSESEQISFHSDIAFRLMGQPEMEPLRITETMYHLLRSAKPQTAANFFAMAQGQTLNASAGAVGSTFVEGQVDAVAALLDQETDNRFQLYRHFINEVFLAMVQYSTPDQAENLISIVEQKLLAVMGEENTIDNILLIALTGLRVATVNLAKQNLDKVKEAFDRSIGIVDRLMELKPAADAFSWENCDALFNLGMICLDMKQTKAAEHCFDIALDLTDQKMAAEPENSPNKLLLASWIVTICRVFQQMQDKEAGKKYFTRGKLELKKAIATKANLISTQQNNTLLERDLMVMYNDFGDLCHENELKDEALAAYQNALIIGERMAESHPESIEMQIAPTITFDRIGKMYADLNDIKKSAEYFEKSLELRKRLSSKAHKDMRLLNDLAAAYHNMASLYLKFNELDKVRPNLVAQLEVMTKIYKANPTVENTIFAWMDSVTSLVDYYYNTEKFGEAEEVLVTALDEIKHFIGVQVSEGLLARIATLHYKTGLVQIKKENYTAAHQNVNASVMLWKQLFEATKNPGYEENLKKAEMVFSGFEPVNKK
ncbi:MAG: tetratricopeptide repeat protein [Bacteroidales bacterium]